MVQVQFDCLAAASAVCDCGQAGPVLGGLCSPCKGKRKVLKKLCVCTGGSTVECLSTCINSRCIKKAPGLADVDPFFFCLFLFFKQLFTRTLTYTDVYSGNKKKKALLPGNRHGKSPLFLVLKGILKGLPAPRLIQRWCCKDGCL